MLLSVVVVSDFEPSAKKSWADEIRVSKALAIQDCEIEFETIFVESAAHRDEEVPPALYEALPDLELVFVEASASAPMKDYGVSIAGGDWIAVIEADCTPEPDWLRCLLRAASEYPEMVAISGRTHYGQDSSYKRVMTLLDRTFNDTGVSRECSFVSNNGALYRAGVIRQFPFPAAITPFLSARLRNIEMKRRGHRFYYERSALMRHEIGGLSFIHDQHMNYGYMEMKLRGNPRALEIPGQLAKHLWFDLRRFRWLGRLYLRWWDWPMAALFLLVVRVPEAIGMFHAVRDVAALPGTAYR